MNRSFKSAFWVAPLVLLVMFSFAGGRRLRQVAAAPVIENARVSSLPEAGIGGLFGLVGRQGDASNPVQTFKEVYDYVKSEFVDRVEDNSKLSQGAVRAMLASLDDPKTRFLEPAHVKSLEDQSNGKFSGIGATVSVVKSKKGTIDYRRLAVVAPAPGGPAAAAGLLAGDLITHLDGKWVIAYNPVIELEQLQTKEMTDSEYRKTLKDISKRLTEGVSLQKALDLLNSADGKKIEITVERTGAPAPIKVSVTTASVSFAPVEVTKISDKVAYLRITQFGPNADSAISEALKEAGDRSLIIDLRDNPGSPVPGDGSLPEAAKKLLAALTKGGKVGNLVVKGNKSDAITVSGVATSAPKLAVLINGGTANTAELVASALKERAGAKLVGSKTFGDAILQRVVNLKSGGAMTIAAGKYLTANGMDFNGKGLVPDIAAAGASPSANDPAAQRALTALAGV